MSTRSSSLLLFTLVGVAACSSSTTNPGPVAVADAGGSHDAAGPSNAIDGGKTTDTDAGAVGGGGTSLSGKLGTLGAVLPTVSSLVISNSGETLIYLSSAPLTCDQLKTSRWLGSATKGSQVVELIVKGAPVLGAASVPPGEVNYAAGGKSSSYEVNASSGSITFTKAAAKGAVEGTVTATFDGGDTLTGTFRAEYCDGGQGY